ncbi:hypothetical protein OIE62_07220 [Streptomyces scopuliridis]|uniref:hypothetical protein n=1 Tax=Streptomyces scopuliridis TaxID=452529 RepID=UPI002DDAD6D3|nr:hypothetical protein [Streptomyces scopuliridis]WSC04827.1 hypothetical protein OIE62_07220 [Streptomyces scopuliridis]
MGIPLAFSEPEKLLDRCETASVRLISGQTGYDEGAVVPRGPWQPLPPEDAERLRADDTAPDSVRIELVRRPLPPFHTDDEEGRLEAAAHLDPLSGRWPNELLGCTASPGGRTTTTEDPTTQLRIGLHVDNFDRLPYARRHAGRRRLCLNLGPGTRYLLLADLDVQQICRALGTDGQHHYPHTQDVRRYVTNGHPLRCLRIRLEPGEGYIAPTELLPHDGSTAGIPEPSLAAFWLGRMPRHR